MNSGVLKWLFVFAFLWLAVGCSTWYKGRAELGFGSRTDYYLYSASKESGGAGFEWDLQPLVNYLVELGLTEQQAADEAPAIARAVEEAAVTVGENGDPLVDNLVAKVAAQGAIIASLERLFGEDLAPPSKYEPPGDSAMNEPAYVPEVLDEPVPMGP